MNGNDCIKFHGDEPMRGTMMNEDEHLLRIITLTEVDGSNMKTHSSNTQNNAT